MLLSQRCQERQSKMKSITMCAAITLFHCLAASQGVGQIPEMVRIAGEARKLLEKESSGFSTKNSCVVWKDRTQHCKQGIENFGVALAVKRSNEPMKVIFVDGKTCLSKTSGYVTDCYTRNGKTNGVNTEFTVEGGYKVYAIKRVIGSAGNFKEVVYTPYSDYLNTKEVRSYGMKYLDRLIATAYEDLKRSDVRSLINSNALVSERVPHDIIQQLIIVEHVDHGRFRSEEMVNLVKEVYAIIGLNQGIAYSYAKSSAKALGLLQVIPGTYAGLKRRYVSAGLLDDFVAGMTSHHNAVKTAILLADHDVGVIKDSVIRAQLLASKAKYRDYVASAYNGGPARAGMILIRGEDHVLHNKNSENKIYVEKIRKVAGMPQSVIISTP